jgi:hypothetical protein
LNKAKATVFIFAIGCHRVSYYEPPKLDGIYFSGYTVLTGPKLDSVEIWTTMDHTPKGPQTLSWGTCGPVAFFTLVNNTNGKQRHSWNSWAWNEAVAAKYGMRYVCLLPLFSGPAPVGRTTRHAMTVALKDVLGDSLPSGQYAVSVQLTVLGSKPVPAGVVDLRVFGSQ